MQNINFTTENNLLRVYIDTLERENQTKNVELNTLSAEIEKMSEQINRLHDLLSKSKSQTNNQQFLQLKEINKQLAFQIAEEKQENTRIIVELQAKQKQISMAQIEKQTLNSKLSDCASQLQVAHRKIQALQSQIKQYKQKNTPTLNNQHLSDKTSNLQPQNVKLKLQIRNDTSETLKDKIERNLLQSQIQNLRRNEYFKQKLKMQQIESKNEQDIKLLKLKIQTLQGTNKFLDGQNNQLKEKIQHHRQQLEKANSALNQYRFKSNNTASLQASKAAKMIQALQQMVSRLKDNKQYLQTSLKQKISIITNLETQLNCLTYNQLTQRDLEDEINNLLLSKADADKQISLLIKNNQDLSYQIQKWKQKEEGYLSELSSFRRQRETLLREINQYRTSLQEARSGLKIFKNKPQQYPFSMKEVSSPRYGPQRDIKRQENEDLRLMVLGLKNQVESLKQNQSVIRHTSNMQTSQVESYLNLNNKSHLIMQSRSPPTRIQDNNQSRKLAQNKNKWQSLQRKINMLRNQNENLKKTLFQ